MQKDFEKLISFCVSIFLWQLGAQAHTQSIIHYSRFCPSFRRVCALPVRIVCTWMWIRDYCMPSDTMVAAKTPSRNETEKKENKCRIKSDFLFAIFTLEKLQFIIWLPFSVHFFFLFLFYAFHSILARVFSENHKIYQRTNRNTKRW